MKYIFLSIILSLFTNTLFAKEVVSFNCKSPYYGTFTVSKLNLNEIQLFFSAYTYTQNPPVECKYLDPMEYDEPNMDIVAKCHFNGSIVLLISEKESVLMPESGAYEKLSCQKIESR